MKNHNEKKNAKTKRLTAGSEKNSELLKTGKIRERALLWPKCTFKVNIRAHLVPQKEVKFGVQNHFGKMKSF